MTEYKTLQRSSTSKTFHAGTEFGEMYDWFLNQIETKEWQPEGTDWSGGEPGPIDPRCDLEHKYTITVIKITP